MNWTGKMNELYNNFNFQVIVQYITITIDGYVQ